MKGKLFEELKGLKNQEKILENPGLPQSGRQVAVTAILTGGLEPTYQKFRSTEKIKEVVSPSCLPRETGTGILCCLCTLWKPGQVALWWS